MKPANDNDPNMEIARRLANIEALLQELLDRGKAQKRARVSRARSIRQRVRDAHALVEVDPKYTEMARRIMSRR